MTLPTLPNLSAARRIAIDVETFDPGISAKLGIGVRRGGFIAGLAVAVDDASWYFPIRHEMGPNMDPATVERWARDQLCRPNQPKVGANLLYDLDYLYHAGIPVAGPFEDVQIAEPLLDEYRHTYSLGSIAERYVGTGKTEDELYQFGAEHFGGPATRKAQAGNIWRMPYDIVAPYARSDVELPLLAIDKQKELLEARGLMPVFELETRLVPMLLRMRQTGVRVDLSKTATVREAVESRIEVLQRSVNAQAGEEINTSSGNSLAILAKSVDEEYTLTDAGNPCFNKAAMADMAHPVWRRVEELKKYRKVLSTFLDGQIGKQQIAGRLHPEFVSVKGESGGTVTGRFSCRSPNVQQISARDKLLAPMIRGLFVPEPGEVWAAQDYSQVEYRLFANYAIGDNGDEIRRAFNDDPKTDYHKFVQSLIHEKTGQLIDRKPIKNINFGSLYGVGPKKLARMLGVELDIAEGILSAYFSSIPSARDTAKRVSKIGEVKGEIQTLSGRRGRFPFWGPEQYEAGKHVKVSRSSHRVRQDIAQVNTMRTFEGLPPFTTGVTRAGTHKALNKLLQGGAADIMKMGMLRIWDAGICEIITPLLTVHDELDWSVPPTREGAQALEAARHELVSAIKLKVPLLVDTELGRDWGSAEELPADADFYTELQRIAA